MDDCSEMSSLGSMMRQFSPPASSSLSSNFDLGQGVSSRKGSRDKRSIKVRAQRGGTSVSDDYAALGMSPAASGFNGAIPSSFSKLTKLKILSLSSNPCLSGTVPAFFGSFHGLEQFLASNTGLKGPIPAAFFGLSNLKHLDLSCTLFTEGEEDLCGIGGAFPSDLSKLVNLEILNLDSAQLSGPIPAGLDKLTNLQELSLNSNKLSGTIPATLGFLKNLQTLNLADNALEGSIPATH